MADDNTKASEPDSNHIDVNENYQLWYWGEKLSATKLELQMAVEKVGPIAKDVSHHLGNS